MTTDARARLRTQLLRDEGLRLKPYVDTVGKVTVGVGRNLTDRGITQTEALYLLENDISRCIRELVEAFPWFVGLDPVRQTVLANMCFNMGIGNTRHGLRSFVNTLNDIQHGRYAEAADKMRLSKWARQVGLRATRLARQMETGVWGEE